MVGNASGQETWRSHGAGADGTLAAGGWWLVAGGWWLVVGSGIGGPPSSDCVAGGAYRILRLGDWGSMRRVRGWRLGDWEGLRRVLDFATGRLGIRPADFATGRLGNENF